MVPAVCGPRIDALGKKLGELQGRKEELTAPMDFERVTPPTVPAPQRQALLRALVEEVRVQGCGAIYPVCRVPTGRFAP